MRTRAILEAAVAKLSFWHLPFREPCAKAEHLTPIARCHGSILHRTTCDSVYRCINERRESMNLVQPPAFMDFPAWLGVAENTQVVEIPVICLRR
jgi:hypothetical protein